LKGIDAVDAKNDLIELKKMYPDVVKGFAVSEIEEKNKNHNKIPIKNPIKNPIKIPVAQPVKQHGGIIRVFPKNKFSKLSYYVTIELVLYPGKSIPLSKQSVIACNNRYENIRQAYADMFGLEYRPREFYQKGYVSPSALKYKKDIEEKEKERKRGEKYNGTRRRYYGGKKTRKHRY
jgi:hypothetical protein